MSKESLITSVRQRLNNIARENLIEYSSYLKEIKLVSILIFCHKSK